MVQDFTPKKEIIGTGLDCVVIRECFADIQGGRTLDCSAFTDTVVKAGHFIAVKEGVYFPAPYDKNGYTALNKAVAEGETASEPQAKYAGVLRASILASEPGASIMTRGVVNDVAMPVKASEEILAAFKADCPFISFEHDEEA